MALINYAFSRMKQQNAKKWFQNFEDYSKKIVTDGQMFETSCSTNCYRRLSAHFIKPIVRNMDSMPFLA
jgi:hypothetical protein